MFSVDYIQEEVGLRTKTNNNFDDFNCLCFDRLLDMTKLKKLDFVFLISCMFFSSLTF